MKKWNLPIMTRSRSGNKTGSSVTYFIKYNVVVFAILFLPLFSLAGTNSPLENVKLSGRSYNYPVGYEGNPYLTEDWMIANLLLEDGQLSEKIKVRLNILTNDLIFYNDELKRVFILDKETIKRFTVNPGTRDSMVFVKYKGENISFKLKNNDYIHELQSGTISFFVKDGADIVNASDVSSKNKIYPKKYYFVKTEKGFSEIKLNVKSIIQLFPDRKKEIRLLAKTNRIKRNSEFSISKLIRLLNNPAK
jgi:hypothetical protein